MRLKLKNVENYLKNIQERGNLKDLTIVHSDSRMGNLIALGEVSEYGSTESVSSDYMTISELYRFLQGYDRAKGNIL